MSVLFSRKTRDTLLWALRKFFSLFRKQANPSRLSKMSFRRHDCVNHGKIGASEVEIGRFTYGFHNITVNGANPHTRLIIGSFCSIGESVTIFLGNNHRTDWATTFPFGHVFRDEFGGESIEGHPSSKGDVVIGNDVWIGHNVTILSGVKIGDGAVLAANATIVKDVAPYEIVAGNPAQCVKERFERKTMELLQKLRWWDLPVEAIRATAPLLSAPPTEAFLKELIEKHRR